MSERIHNFSAGPAVLPVPVLEQVRDELLNYQGSGMSVMEMSHRGKVFTKIIEAAEAGVRKNMDIPDDYHVLFLQGGASLQFAMAPMNLYLEGRPVDMLHTGSWTKKAIEEIEKTADLRMAGSSEPLQFRRLPKGGEIMFSPDASYVHICSNNTIAGTQWQSFPDSGPVPMVADMSSDIFSRPVDVTNFGMIFAGAQKNLGPSGVTLVIIHKELVERGSKDLPTMLQYRTHAENGSMYNTPPTFGIYIIKLVMEWIENQGGLEGVQKNNEKKAKLLYDAINGSEFYYSPIDEHDRSRMNVVFRVTDDNEELEKKFIAEATEQNLSGLKGHRSVGGLRASIYNACPLESVEALVSFMKEFEKKNA